LGRSTLVCLIRVLARPNLGLSWSLRAITRGGVISISVSQKRVLISTIMLRRGSLAFALIKTRVIILAIILTIAVVAELVTIKGLVLEAVIVVVTISALPSRDRL